MTSTAQSSLTLTRLCLNVTRRRQPVEALFWSTPTNKEVILLLKSGCTRIQFWFVLNSRILSFIFVLQMLRTSYNDRRWRGSEWRQVCRCHLLQESQQRTVDGNLFPRSFSDSTIHSFWFVLKDLEAISGQCNQGWVTTGPECANVAAMRGDGSQEFIWTNIEGKVVLGYPGVALNVSECPCGDDGTQKTCSMENVNSNTFSIDQ